MFHTEHTEIAKLLLTGNFGLERETLRVKGRKALLFSTYSIHSL